MEGKPKQASILERSDVLRRLLNSISDVILLFDAEGRLLQGASQLESVPVPADAEQFLDCVHEGYRIDVKRTFVRVTMRGKPVTVEYPYIASKERILWLESTGIPLFEGETADVSHVAVVTRDITKRKTAEESLRMMAFHDPLTGLPNRRLFKDNLLQSLAQAKRNRSMVGLLYLDIDDFKRINDTMGHETGDEFLKAFAKRVRSCIRDIDMVARMGGDEFTVLLPAVDSAASVEKVAKRIFQAISSPWDTRGYRFDATVSGGIVLYPADGEDALTLMRHVDNALYRVKGSGRNRYVFYESEPFKQGNAESPAQSPETE